MIYSGTGHTRCKGMLLTFPTHSRPVLSAVDSLSRAIIFWTNIMPSLASNRYSVLSEDDSDSKDLRIEMEEIHRPGAETEPTQTREVRGVSASNPMTYLIAFGL